MRPILRMLPWVLLTTMCAACQVQLDDLQDDAQDALEEVRTRAIELGELSAEELRDLWAMEYKTVEMTTADLDSLDERLNALAARGESPAAFDRRCIAPGCVAHRSNTPGMLPLRTLAAARFTALGATRHFHHGLLGKDRWEAYHVSEDGERQVFFFQRRKSKAIAYLTNLLKVGAITF